MKQISDEWLDAIRQLQLWLVQYTFRSILDNFKPVKKLVLKTQATKQRILQFAVEINNTHPTEQVEIDFCYFDMKEASHLSKEIMTLSPNRMSFEYPSPQSKTNLGMNTSLGEMNH